ncbi:hypothetical protein RRG08_056781, partial [Elysia crispata]
QSCLGGRNFYNRDHLELVPRSVTCCQQYVAQEDWWGWSSDNSGSNLFLSSVFGLRRQSQARL